MSRKTKERKARQRARKEARRLTPGKVFRLLLKSAAFALFVGILFTAADRLGLPGADRAWVRFALIFGIYLLTYPFLMSEFRPKLRAVERGK